MCRVYAASKSPAGDAGQSQSCTVAPDVVHGLSSRRSFLLCSGTPSRSAGVLVPALPGFFGSSPVDSPLPRPLCLPSAWLPRLHPLLLSLYVTSLLRYCPFSSSWIYTEFISSRKEMRYACSLWKPLNASSEKVSDFSWQFYVVKSFAGKRNRLRSYVCENEDPQAGVSGFKVQTWHFMLNCLLLQQSSVCFQLRLRSYVIT